MNKAEAIAKLRTLVAIEDMKRGESTTIDIEKVTGLYPHRWTPYKNGIRWQGFYIRRLFGPFDFEYGTLHAAAKSTETRRKWWGRQYEHTEMTNHAINSAADLLRILEHKEPYDG